MFAVHGPFELLEYTKDIHTFANFLKAFFVQILSPGKQASRQTGKQDNSVNRQ